MTAPAPPPGPGPYPYQRGYWSLSRCLLVIGTVLFTLAAFAAGGPALLAQTVEQATGVRLDHYVEVGFAGEGLRAGPELTPAAAAYLRIPDVAEIGVEYYASLGPVKHVPRLAQQEHYLFGAGNLLALAGWELNAGVGAGLTDGSTDLIAKLIVGHSLGRLWGRDRGHVASGSPARGTARR